MNRMISPNLVERIERESGDSSANVCIMAYEGCKGSDDPRGIVGGVYERIKEV